LENCAALLARLCPARAGIRPEFTCASAEVLAWPPPGETDESPLPISVPQLARRAITARIARLNQPTQRVLQAAAIGAAAIDVELVAALTGLPRAAVEDALAVLEHARLVTFEGHRYAIAAPLIARSSWPSGCYVGSGVSSGCAPLQRSPRDRTSRPACSARSSPRP
jgi:hypothetical protein